MAGAPTVLVTGGAGFMGSAFAAAAADGGYRVVVFDALTYAGDERRLAERGVPYELIVGDVADERAVNAALRTVVPAAVVHYAAESHVSRAEVEPETTMRTNVVGTARVLEAAHAHRVPHVVHISTAEVYGERLSGHASETDRAEAPAAGVYVRSKWRADTLARRYAGSIPVAVVRPTIAFGPYQHPEKALPRWICNALDGRPLEIWGDGSPVRQWLAVEDVADAVLRVVRSGSTGVVNVGAQHRPEIRNLDLARRVVRAAGADPSLVRLVPGENRRGERRFSVTAERIAALGWTAEAFAGRLDATVAWYAAHRPWWGPLRAEAEALYQSSDELTVAKERV